MPFKSKAHQAAVMMALKKDLLLTRHDTRGLQRVTSKSSIAKQGYYGRYNPFFSEIELAHPLRSRRLSHVMTGRHEVGHHVMTHLPDAAQTKVGNALLATEGKRTTIKMPLGSVSDSMHSVVFHYAHELFADVFAHERNRRRLLARYPTAKLFSAPSPRTQKTRDILAYALRARKKRKKT